MRALLFAVLCVASSALAQYPSRAVKIVVTIPPGGAPDIAARDHRPEAVGELRPAGGDREPTRRERQHRRTSEVARAAPDGYTLILARRQPDHDQPAPLFEDADRHAARTWRRSRAWWRQPVRAVGEPVAAGEDLPGIHRATRRRRTRRSHYASGGNGSQHQLTMEMLKRRAGIDLRARALQGRRAGHHGDGGGRSRGDVSPAPRPRRRSRRARCAPLAASRRAALGALSRAADDRRVLSRASRTRSGSGLFGPRGNAGAKFSRSCRRKSKRALAVA